MKIKKYWPVLMVVLLLVGCSEDPVTPTPTGPLFSLTVTDTLGAPAPGINVGSINQSPYFQAFKTSAPGKISGGKGFSLPVEAYIEYRVLDFNRDTVKLLAAGIFDAGSYTIVWDGRDENDSLVPGGYYFYYLVASNIDNGAVVFEDETAFVIERGNDPATATIGQTDAEGKFITDDVALFPGIIPNPPTIIRTDDFGNVIDTIEVYYTDTVTIALSDPAVPDRFLLTEMKLESESNQINLTWDPTAAEEVSR